MGQITRPKPPPPRRRSPLARIAVIVLLSVTGAAAVVTPYWWIKIRPRMKRLENPLWGKEPSRAGRAEIRPDSLEIFDRVADLPGDPLGIAWNGREFVVGNRLKPWGFMRLRREDDAFEVEKVPVIEPRYDQTMDFWGVTWNGTNYIGHTSAAWFGKKEGYVFTIHDPKTLQIVAWKPAPPDLGCLTFDGSHYWAATRKNTEETDEETFLWKLDENFNVVAKYEPPSIGCQGLAWDGAHLWVADVFSDYLYVLDVSGEKPEVVHSHYSGVGYLSGVAFDGKNIWVSEYDDKRIHRLKPSLRAEWTGEPGLIPVQIAGIVAPADPAELEELERKLRSDDWSDRMKAGMRLRELGRPIRFDREQDSFAKREREDTAVFDWSAEMRDGAIYASWHIYFGEDLFNTEGESGGIVSIPKFARYEITIKGETLERPIERVFEAEPGDNIRRDVLLASGLDPGKYEISLFLHVQYRTPDGTDRILNRSAMTLDIER